MGETQFDFRNGLSTRQTLFLCLLDFEKALDKVSYSKMIKVFNSTNTDDKNLKIIANLYKNDNTKKILCGHYKNLRH